MAAFSLRIIDASYYMEKPIQGLDFCFSEFRQTAIYHVPVIRIFGTTALGQKSCLHIHQIFPYLYVPLPAGVDNGLRFCKEFAMSLDSALTISFGKSVSQQRQHVYKVEIVKKIPFYGYYKNEKDFLQIYLYNPNHVSVAGDLLINGSVMNQFFQPFETHIPFILQFFIDYNLHGMNFINLSSVLFRAPLPKKDTVSNLTFSSPHTSDLFQSPLIKRSNFEVFTEETVHESHLLNVKKQSTCAVEVDALESAILNKNSIMESIGTNPGLNELWEDEKQRLRDNHESSIIKISESQDREEFITNDEKLSLKKLKDIIDERRLKLSEDLLNLSTTSDQGSYLNSLLATTLEQDSLGLGHEEDDEHDDDENESILMSQTVNDIINHPDNSFLSTQSYMWSNPLLDDQENQCVEMLNNSPIKSIKCDNSKDSIVFNESRVNKEKSFIPQLDGNSDLCRESSSEDFQSYSRKRKRKKLKKQSKSKKKSSSFEINRSLDCSTTSSLTLKNISNKSSLECRKSCVDDNFKYIIKDNLVFPKVYPSRVRNKNSHEISDIPVLCSKDCLIKFSPNIKQEKKKRTLKTALKSEKSEFFFKNKEYLQKKYNLKNCQVVLCNDKSITQQHSSSSKLQDSKNKLKYNLTSTTNKHFSSKKYKTHSDVNQIKTSFEYNTDQEDCLISESPGEIDCSRNLIMLTGVTSLTSFKENHSSTLISSSQFIEEQVLNTNQTYSNDKRSEQTCSNDKVFEQICLNDVVSEQTCSSDVVSEQIFSNDEISEQFCSNDVVSVQIFSNDKSSEQTCFNDKSSEQTCSNDKSSEQTCSNYKSSEQTCSNDVGTMQTSLNEEIRNNTLNINLKVSSYCNKEPEALIEKHATLSATSVLETSVKDCWLKVQNSDFNQSNYGADFSHNTVVLKEKLNTFKSYIETETLKEASLFKKDLINIYSPIESCNIFLEKQVPSEQANNSKNLCSPNMNLNYNNNTLKIDFTNSNKCKTLFHKEDNTSYNETTLPFTKVGVLDIIDSADKTSTKSSQQNYLENTKKTCHKRLQFPVSSVQNCSSNFTFSMNYYIYTPLEKPPSYNKVLSTLSKNNLQEIIYEAPFYSDKKDVAGTVTEKNNPSCSTKVKTLPKYSTNLPLVTLDYLQQNQLQQLQSDIFKSPSGYDQAHPLLADMLNSSKIVVITPCLQPPKYSAVLHWLHNQKECKSPMIKSHIHAKSLKPDVDYALQKESLQANPDIENACLFPALATSPSLQNSNEPEISTPCGFFSDKDPIVAFEVDEIQSHKKTIFKGINSSDIEGFTPNNTYAFKTTQQNIANAKAIHFNQSLTIASIELHIQTRRNLRPDPTIDPIILIFYTMHQELLNIDVSGVFITDTCMIYQNSSNLLKKAGIAISSTHCFSDELLMLKGFSSFIQEHDPDILVGYEVQMLSIGYLIERAAALNYNMCHAMSRISSTEVYSKKVQKDQEDNWFGQLVSMEITGRIILNLWRIMRSEIALQIYTFENVFYHICHQRVAAYSFCSLSEWWLTNSSRWRVIDYYLKRCQGNIRLLDQIDFINRTSELARIFGILFYSVISRGSQFRVESMMLRIAKPMNFIPMSPSPHQRARMSAPECIPLVMEPESRFYVDPVIVLDFQSLYPSIIIAYNYCFSTCIGRVKLCAENELFNFGAASLNLPFHVLEELLNDSNVHISPNGVGFVKKDVRTGIIPRMLDEILSTRVMVKSSMKKAKANKVLYKLLDSRQLGLKLIANVTYGYTAANFSGRMPCIEVGDSVVRKGRETLERAIHLVNSTEKWNARVVYGDTDSLFVLLKGASKETAFAVSAEIVDAVSALNPKPIKLKFEKVYQPCFLITKKRYVGYMYESLDQKVPIFDAKGIETVRRDNCPAVGKVLEKSLRILFEKNDLSLVKKYVQNQFVKIMEGNVILRDFIIAKEYRGLNNYKPGACVPALALTRKQLKLDRRAEPRIGERVPYVISHGSPGLTLIQLVRSPMELIHNNNLRLNEAYYITKQLCPSLDRIFSLIGVNVAKWFVDLPRITRVNDREFESDDNKKGMISHYFSSNHCLICSQLTNHKVCFDCRNDSQRTVFFLNSKCRAIERRYIHFTTLCQHCTSTRFHQSNCISLDCPVFFKLSNISRDLQRTKEVRHIISEF
ncbi:uncharacterized protein LOC100213595 isoform X4 [Hydra vulgaris]|uniref:DNA polymerase zeta catalytic subunit n=1 Tax=Hydra vulgaris TaxID=6087 RepID=A0ABM4BHS2_HYDVU